MNLHASGERLEMAEAELRRELAARIADDWSTTTASERTTGEPWVVEVHFLGEPDRYVTIEAGGGTTRGYEFRVMGHVATGDGSWTAGEPRKFSYAGTAVVFALQEVVPPPPR